MMEYTVHLFMDEDGDFTFEIQDLSGDVLCRSAREYADERGVLEKIRKLGMTPKNCVVKVQDWDPWTQCEIWNLYSGAW